MLVDDLVSDKPNVQVIELELLIWRGIDLRFGSVSIQSFVQSCDVEEVSWEGVV